MNKKNVVELKIPTNKNKQNGKTKHDYFMFSRVVLELSKTRKNAKFSYAASKNIRKLKNILIEISEAQKPMPEYIKFDKERVELCKKLCKKDENKKPIIIDNNYTFEDKPAFDKVLDNLTKKYKITIDEEESKHKKLKLILDESYTIDLHKVDIEFFPDVTDEEMRILEVMLLQ